MHFTAAMSGGWRSKGSEVATGLLIPPALLFGTKSSRRHRHQFLPNCELVHTHLRSSGTRRAWRRTRYDPTCETHTRLADDRPAFDRRIGGDYGDRDLDCSLATNLGPARGRHAKSGCAPVTGLF
jgi:hypothetical protein